MYWLYRKTFLVGYRHRKTFSIFMQKRLTEKQKYTWCELSIQTKNFFGYERRICFFILDATSKDFVGDQKFTINIGIFILSILKIFSSYSSIVLYFWKNLNYENYKIFKYEKPAENSPWRLAAQVWDISLVIYYD